MVRPIGPSTSSRKREVVLCGSRTRDGRRLAELGGRFRETGGLQYKDVAHAVKG
jgi:hypothetical protein